MVNRRDFLGCAALAAAGGCVSGLPDLSDASACPGWKPGELDIHFIQTGVGEQTFFILPDGTTMLVDCGDQFRIKYLPFIPRRPTADRLGGEWVSRYVQRLVPQREIDYFVLTHWHGDHCGKPDMRCETSADGRKICGVTRFAEDFGIRNFISRSDPDAGVPTHGADWDSVEMMRRWIPDMCERRGMKRQAFEVGALNQLKMLRPEASAYRDVFAIRNLHADCRYWDGRGIVDYAPEYVRRRPDLKGKVYENSLSLGFRLDYGKFAAYFGGDIDFPDYEDRLAPVIGPVDVCKMNHHGCSSSMGATLCRELKARLYLASTWSPNQIDETNLVNMGSRELYPGGRFICPGYLPPFKLEAFRKAGHAFADDFLPVQGHVVVKVAPGGGSWRFFVLTDRDESMRVIYRSEVFA